VQRRTFAEVFAICQHFYCKSFPYATAPAQNAGVGRRDLCAAAARRLDRAATGA
jgi:hypothetical protein